MTKSEQRERIREADIVPGVVLDKTIDRATMGHDYGDDDDWYSTPYDPDAENPGGLGRYSRDLRLVLDFVSDEMDGVSLTIARGRDWQCVLEWTDKTDGVLYGGEGEDKDPALAVCRALLAMYAVEVVPE